MKLNKYIFATLITSTTLFLGSCSDFLDRSPQGQFTEDDNPNALVNGKIYNVYTLMRNYDVTAGPPALAIHCFRSEDSEKGSISSDGSEQAAMYTHRPTACWVLIGEGIMPSFTNVMTFLPLLQRKRQPDRQKLKILSTKEKPLSSALIVTSIW